MIVTHHTRDLGDYPRQALGPISAYIDQAESDANQTAFTQHLESYGCASLLCEKDITQRNNDVHRTPTRLC